LIDGDEVGEIDHEFGEAQGGDAVAAAAFEADQQPRSDFALQEGRVAVGCEALHAMQLQGVDVENGIGELIARQIGVARDPELVLEPAPDFRDGLAVQRVRGSAGLGEDEPGESLLFGEEQGLRDAGEFVVAGLVDGGDGVRYPTRERLGFRLTTAERQLVECLLSHDGRWCACDSGRPIPAAVFCSSAFRVELGGGGSRKTEDEQKLNI